MFEDPAFDLALDKAETKVFDQMERDMRDARQWLDDPAVFRLAHPARVAATPAAAPGITLITMAEARNQRLVRELLAKQLGTIDVFEALEAADDRRLRSFWLLHTGTAEVTGGFGNGSAGPTMHAMRFALAGGRVYSFTERAIELLEKTRLGTDIPVSELLNLPAPNIYIELGRTRDPDGLTLYNSQSGLHPLEGAYVSSVVDSSGRARLEVTLTGSPVGRDDLMDDAVEWTCMRADGDVSVTQALTEAYTTTAKPELNTAYFDNQQRLLDQAKASLPKLELVAKCILYLGLDEALKSEVPERTEAKRALTRAQSGAHRRKAARVVARSYDRMVVDSPPETESEYGASAGRTVSPHWREAHFRFQRFGPGLSKGRVIRIARTFVHPGVTNEN